MIKLFVFSTRSKNNQIPSSSLVLNIVIKLFMSLSLPWLCHSLPRKMLITIKYQIISQSRWVNGFNGLTVPMPGRVGLYLHTQFVPCPVSLNFGEYSWRHIRLSSLSWLSQRSHSAASSVEAAPEAPGDGPVCPVLAALATMIND